MGSTSSWRTWKAFHSWPESCHISREVSEKQQLKIHPLLYTLSREYQQSISKELAVSFQLSSGLAFEAEEEIPLHDNTKSPKIGKMKWAGLKIPSKSMGPYLIKAQKQRHPNKLNCYHCTSRRAGVAPGIVPHLKDEEAAQNSVRVQHTGHSPTANRLPVLSVKKPGTGLQGGTCQ